MNIHKREPSGGILAFLTGKEEITVAIELLKEQATANDNDHMYILPMYGALNDKELKKAFYSPPKGSRKIILCTNIAETSITVPGITYVIDCGFVKMNFFKPDAQAELFMIVPISKAAAEQRAGRVGRTNEGKIFRLYTEEEYDKLATHTLPEIRRTDVSTLILQLKAMGVDNILRFDFPTAPPANNFLCAVETLLALGAIDEDANLTNEVGIFLATIPLSVMMGKMLWASAERGCSEEILNIIAMLQIKSVFIKGVTGQESIASKQAKRRFEVIEGDLISLLNVYTAFVESNQSKEFCRRNYLNYNHLKRATEIKTQLAKLIESQCNLPCNLSSNNTETIIRCITAGFFPNAAYLHHSGVYRKVRGDTELKIHPLSCLYTEKPPKYVLYTELLHTTQLFMKDLTVVDPQWLLEIAPHYYHISSVPPTNRNSKVDSFVF